MAKKIRPVIKRVTKQATALLPFRHAIYQQSLSHIIDHAKAGRVAYADNRDCDVRYHMTQCKLQLWRLGVDGMLDSGEAKTDGTKYEPFLVDRLSSEKARMLRGNATYRNKAQSSLDKVLSCEHIVPRSTVATILALPDHLDLNDIDLTHRFLRNCSEVAIITKVEDRILKQAGFESEMPEEWWKLGSIEEMIKQRYMRYIKARVQIERYPVSGDSQPLNHKKLDRRWKCPALFLLPIYKALRDGMSTYEATRGLWKPVSSEFREMNGAVALGLVNGIAQTAYNIDEWLQVGDRFEFAGRENSTLRGYDMRWARSLAPGFWGRGGYLVIELDGKGKYRFLRGREDKLWHKLP